MNKEIEEILERLKNHIEHIQFAHLTNYELRLLYDYITKLQGEINKLTSESTEWEARTYYWQDKAEVLQEENKKLKDDKDSWHRVAQRNYNELSDRIDKAIEYIETTNNVLLLSYPPQEAFNKDKLLEILKGE